LGQALGEIERGRPADIILEVTLHLALEGGVVLRRRIGALEIEDERHQRLGDEAAAVEAEMPALVGTGAEGIGLLDGHALLMVRLAADTLVAARAATMKAWILSGSFSPGRRSTPDETSTPGAPVTRSASATLSASRPPESMNGTRAPTCSRSRQSNGWPSPPGRVAAAGARASNSRRSVTCS